MFWLGCSCTNTVEPGVNMGKAQIYEMLDIAMDMENCLYSIVR